MLQRIHPTQHPIYGLAGVIAGGRISKVLSVDFLACGTWYRVRLEMTDNGITGPRKKPFLVNVCIPVGWTDFQVLRECLRNLMNVWASY